MKLLGASFLGGVMRDVHVKVLVVPAVAGAVTVAACEVVSNAGRHSGAARVSRSLRRLGSSVRLRVGDNGSGFDPAVPADGFGLISMRDRAGSIGGDLQISFVPERGTDVKVTL